MKKEFLIKTYIKLGKFVHSQYQKLTDEDVDNSKINRRVRQLTISNHALLRYIERIKLVDIEQCMREMTAENLPERVKRLRDGNYPMEGFSVRVLNNTVVTVIDKERNWKALKPKE